MSAFPSTIRAFLELMRISNVATVASNVLVGAAIATAASDQPIPWVAIAMITVAMAAFYVGGMALNDVVDAKVDAKERPERPVPSGRVSRAGAAAFAGVMFAIGLALMAMHGAVPLAFAGALLATIVAYDILHKRYAGSVVLMGLCRSLVYLTAASAIVWPLDWSIAGPLAGAIGLYIVVLTIVARVESKRDAGSRGQLAFLLPLVVVLPITFVRPIGPALWSFITGAIVVGWILLATRHVRTEPPRIKHAVLAWLAGISLVDAFFLTLLNAPILAMMAGGCFIITLIAHRWIEGT